MFLPQELMIQILVWLPVKSLTRFKCVSLSIDFEALLDDDSGSVSLDLDRTFPQHFTDIEVEIKGSCRGFILLCHTFDLYLWNPSTGFHKQIPISPFGFNLDCFYGFGYDHSTDDYLVVLMFQHDLYNPTLQLLYFSLKGNTWKQVEGPHYRYTNRNREEPKGGSLYNGAIHWLAHRDDLLTEVIVAFDLVEKKLSYILLPCDSDGSPLHCGLWVYGESLSIYTTNYATNTVDIFVMKEYKVDSSWTMTHALPYDVIPNEGFCPLCCTKNGDIVGRDDGGGLVKYDKNGQFLEHHSYTNDDLPRQWTMYIESLLSLPSDGDNQQA
ncbi:F-box/kelch-repeat protein At3g06240-like [Vicia villosa]|uniref:F-box/kelch-repeat protein At3g06240-like n=1 Tax=Vicia villosa TaxID=3911 RepID=UPI00273AA5AC|nr:F-box/kelch-repeat protein At3g06240-like [Vicia villosa]